MLTNHRQRKARAAQPFALDCAEIDIAKPDFASRRLYGARYAAQQRRLAAAVTAENDDELARRDRQIKVAQRQFSVWIPQRSPRTRNMESPNAALAQLL